MLQLSGKKLLSFAKIYSPLTTKSRSLLNYTLKNTTRKRPGNSQQTLTLLTGGILAVRRSFSKLFTDCYSWHLGVLCADKRPAVTRCKLQVTEHIWVNTAWHHKVNGCKRLSNNVLTLMQGKKKILFNFTLLIRRCSNSNNHNTKW
jgi:hypothetical protein